MTGRGCKQKGNSYERELVKEAQDAGLIAMRAWGSNGKALGMHEEVDCVIAGYKVQAKRRKSIADFMKPSEHVDIQVIREDRGTSLAIMPYSLLVSLLGGKNV